MVNASSFAKLEKSSAQCIPVLVPSNKKKWSRIKFCWLNHGPFQKKTLAGYDMESCSYPIIDRRKSKYSSVGRTKEKHLASSTGFSYPIMIGTPWYHSWYHPSITLRMFQLCHNVSIIIPSWLKTLISSQFLHLWLPTRAEPLRHDRHDRLPSPEAWRVKSCTTWDALNVKCCDIYLTAAQYVGSWNVGFLEQETSPSLWNGYFFGDGSKASHRDVILSSNI